MPRSKAESWGWRAERGAHRALLVLKPKQPWGGQMGAAGAGNWRAGRQAGESSQVLSGGVEGGRALAPVFPSPRYPFCSPPNF